ncbi:ABC transporter permease subunit [Nonomuraea thailandensis]
MLDAELRGLPPATIALRYVLPMVAAPATRLLAVTLGGLVAGTAVAETLFGLAGLGELLVTAISTRDVPVVQSVALLAAAVVVAGLAAADGARRGTAGP